MLHVVCSNDVRVWALSLKNASNESNSRQNPGLRNPKKGREIIKINISTSKYRILTSSLMLKC